MSGGDFWEHRCLSTSAGYPTRGDDVGTGGLRSGTSGHMRKDSACFLSGWRLYFSLRHFKKARY